MTPKYQNKYRIQSARLAGWDYSWDGGYFVTICTHHRVCIFGDVVDDSDGNAIMQLSEIGGIANDCWVEIPNHFPFARLGVHVVMPNHVHGIVIIDKPSPDVRNSGELDSGDAIHRVSTSDSPKKPSGGATGMKNPMLHKNLSRIIRWYKGHVTFESRKVHADFKWQSRFHDRVIRDGEEFDRISEYIINNPRKWRRDKFYLNNPTPAKKDSST